MQHICKH